MTRFVADATRVFVAAWVFGLVAMILVFSLPFLASDLVARVRRKRRA
jgi:hypothetical protein